MATARIFIFENNAYIAEDIQYKLQDMGYAVLGTLGSGDNVIEKIQGVSSDLVLMNMGSDAGLKQSEIVDTLYDRLNIPVVYLFNNIHEKHLELVKRPGCFGFIKHPLTYEEVKVAVEMAIQRHKREKDEKEKKSLETHLMQAEKMEAVGTLAGGIAHEFNNIMAIITGNAELALDDTHEKDPVHWHINEILEGCLRARDVVKQILTFSRQAKQDLTPIKLGPVIRGSLKVLKPMLPLNIKICEHIPSRSDSVNADPILIQQVLLNLCTNAVHAMQEKGGILTIGLEKTELSKDAGIHIIGLAPGSYLKLSITDTGMGMDSETQKKIFNPYFTTKEVGKGTGIGLSIVHGIVANHGGAVTVASESGVGTTVDVFLPVIMDASNQLKKDAKSPPKGSEKILFVDDDEPIAAAVNMVLRRLGYDIVALTNPITALDVFKKQPDTFDLVITDLAMPQMTGIAFLKHLRNIRMDIPVIVCTGYSDKLNSQNIKEMGINAFMLKPLVRQQLAETIRSVLDKAVDRGYEYGAGVSQAAVQCSRLGV